MIDSTCEKIGIRLALGPLIHREDIITRKRRVGPHGGNHHVTRRALIPGSTNSLGCLAQPDSRTVVNAFLAFHSAARTGTSGENDDIRLFQRPVDLLVRGRLEINHNRDSSRQFNISGLARIADQGADNRTVGGQQTGKSESDLTMSTND